MAIIISGLLVSGLYALIAVGFTMIYGVGRVENLAHGAYAMVAAYVFYAVTAQLQLPIPVGFILAILTGVALALATYKGLIGRFLGNPTAIFISTLLLAVVLEYAISVVFTPASRNLLPIVPGTSNVLGIRVSNDLILVTIVSWVCLGGLLFFVRRSHLGRAIRAISEGPRGALILGINVERANLVVWALAGALAAIAGVFFGAYTHLVPHMWVFPLVIAFSIVIVGGIGSIEGSIIAAYVIGMAETAMMMMISTRLRGVFSMGILIVILLARPRGFLGKEM
ncbi:MAG: branched-chain amino acid ABC transporter permease [Dehalococcoidia bacterium]